MNLSLFTDFLSFIKIQHWVAPKHSHHEILGDLYDDLSDKIDEFVECALGLFELSQVEATSTPIDADMGVELHTKIKNKFNEVYVTWEQYASQSSALMSLLDDMTNIVSRAAYLLKMK